MTADEHNEFIDSLDDDLQTLGLASDDAETSQLDESSLEEESRTIEKTLPEFEKTLQKKGVESGYQETAAAGPEPFSVDIPLTCGVTINLKTHDRNRQAFITVKGELSGEFDREELRAALEGNSLSQSILEKPWEALCQQLAAGTVPAADLLIAQGVYADSSLNQNEECASSWVNTADTDGDRFYWGRGMPVTSGSVVLSFDSSHRGASERDVFGGEHHVTDIIRELVLTDSLEMRETDDRVQIIALKNGFVHAYDNTLTVKKAVDGYADIEPDKEGLSVTMHLYTAQEFGRPLSFASVMEQLKKQGIVFGIDEERIQREIKRSARGDRNVSFVCAEGRKPQHGQDGTVRFHVPVMPKPKAKTVSQERVDYRERENIFSAKQGEKIMTIVPPRPPGEEGKTVFGEPVPALAGEPYRIEIGGGLSTVPGQDGTAYTAQIDGHIKYDAKAPSILVEPVLLVDEVNFEFGNLHFRGDVTVEGNIDDNMVVDIHGDLSVKGHIYQAQVNVTGAVICEKGVHTTEKGDIICDGDLTTRYIEDSQVHCCGNVTVEKGILNSSVYCNKTLTVSDEKGQIVGGEIHVRDNIVAPKLGSEHGVKTIVVLGNDYIQSEKNAYAVKLYKTYKEKLEKINQVIEKFNALKAAGRTIPDKLAPTYKRALYSKNKILKSLNTLKYSLDTYRSAALERRCRIDVSDQLCPDVRIIVGKTKWIVEKPETTVRFVKQKGAESLQRVAWP
jgi:uncharacterized protein